MYRVLFSKKARKELSKIARVDTKRIIEKLRGLDYPFPPNFDIDKVESKKDFYRLRVGRTRTCIELDFNKKEIWMDKEN